MTEYESPKDKIERLAATISPLTNEPLGVAACGCPNNIYGMAPLLHICSVCGDEGPSFFIHPKCNLCERTRTTNASISHRWYPE